MGTLRITQPHIPLVNVALTCIPLAQVSLDSLQEGFSVTPFYSQGTEAQKGEATCPELHD